MLPVHAPLERVSISANGFSPGIWSLPTATHSPLAGQEIADSEDPGEGGG
jgi:hypothetical protein